MKNPLELKTPGGRRQALRAAISNRGSSNRDQQFSDAWVARNPRCWPARPRRSHCSATKRSAIAAAWRSTRCRGASHTLTNIGYLIYIEDRQDSLGTATLSYGRRNALETGHSASSHIPLMQERPS